MINFAFRFPTSDFRPPLSDLRLPLPLPNDDWLRTFRRKLKRWYTQHKRTLPWRDQPTLYRVWISEIMLQQTQVVTVIDYFQRFIERFPDVQLLAAAGEEEVLRYWEGLGYYRRARQMHKAAQVIVNEHGGEFPTHFDDVLALPGVGRYTAGAILSIGGGQRQPILEANTIRLYARLMELDADLQTTASQNQLWEFAELLLPPKAKDAGDLNQALMELGSEVCKPKLPLCDACPVQTLCPTHAAGREQEIPRPKKKTEFTAVTHFAAIIASEKNVNQILLRKCAEGERFAGMWDFPRVELSANKQQPDVSQLFAELLGLEAEVSAHLKTIKHGITRYRITLECYRLTAKASHLKRLAKQSSGQLQLFDVSDLDELPLSSTGRKIANLLQLT